MVDRIDCSNVRNPFWKLEEEERRVVAQAQRAICIKWMKEHCYRKAERELPDSRDKMDGGEYVFHHWGQDWYVQAQQDMTEEVEGVAFRACEEIGK